MSKELRDRLNHLFGIQEAYVTQLNDMKEEIGRVRTWALKDNDQLNRILDNLEAMADSLKAGLEELGKDMGEFRKDFRNWKESESG